MTAIKAELELDMMDAFVQEMHDKAALYDLAMRYCRAIDRRDAELLKTVYHDDGHDQHGTFFDGPAVDFIANLPQTMAPFEITAHHISNVMYRIDGERAEGELYFVAYHRTLRPPAQHITVRGRYLDRYERRNGEWRIAHRSLVWDSHEASDVTAEDTKMLAALGDVGGAADDASYASLKLLPRGR